MKKKKKEIHPVKRQEERRTEESLPLQKISLVHKIGTTCRKKWISAPAGKQKDIVGAEFKIPKLVFLSSQQPLNFPQLTAARTSKNLVDDSLFNWWQIHFLSVSVNFSIDLSTQLGSWKKRLCWMISPRTATVIHLCLRNLESLFALLHLTLYNFPGSSAFSIHVLPPRKLICGTWVGIFENKSWFAHTPGHNKTPWRI